MPPAIAGRTTDLDALSALLDAGGALVLTGPGGAGKWWLLAASAEEATRRGARVLRVAGSRVLTTSPYAALAELLSPELDAVPGLPAPLRDALSTAVWCGTGSDVL